MESKVAAYKAEHDAATASLTEHKARLKECDKGISACAQRKEGLTRQIAELGIDRKKMEHECASSRSCAVFPHVHCVFQPVGCDAELDRQQAAGLSSLRTFS